MDTQQKRIKNVIPNLVSLETPLSRIPGFYLSQLRDFYGTISQENKFHYTAEICNDLTFPSEYDFRYGYYFKSGNYWCYEKKLYRNISLKFMFDPEKRLFRFNSLYLKVPTGIGGILPVGKHIADFINLDLFLAGYLVVRGCAFQYKGKTICVIMPSYNGKTTLALHILDKKGLYLSEDMVIIDLLHNKLFPTSPHKFNYARRINRKLFKKIKDTIITSESHIDFLYLMQNATGKAPIAEKNFSDFIWLNSLIFLNNYFIRSFVFEEKLLKKVQDQQKYFEDFSVKWKFKNVLNFDFEKILDKTARE